MPNVLPDHFLVSTHCRNKVPPRPEMLSHEILAPPPIQSRQMNRALALDVPHHLRHRVLRRYRDHHVHMIRHQVPFLNLAFPLICQFAKHLMRPDQSRASCEWVWRDRPLRQRPGCSRWQQGLRRQCPRLQRLLFSWRRSSGLHARFRLHQCARTDAAFFWKDPAKLIAPAMNPACAHPGGHSPHPDPPPPAFRIRPRGTRPRLPESPVCVNAWGESVRAPVLLMAARP